MSTHLRTTVFVYFSSVALLIAPIGLMVAQVPPAEYLDAAAAAEMNAPEQPIMNNPEMLKRDVLKNAGVPMPVGVEAGFGRGTFGIVASDSGPGTTSIHEAEHEPSKKDKKALVKAELKLAKGDSEAALKILRDLLKGEARPNALTIMGQEHLHRAFQDRTQLPVALEELTEAAGARPNDGPLHANLAVAELLHGRNDLALKAAEAALRVDPTQPKTRYILGQTLANLGRTKEAIYHLRLAAPDLKVAADLAALLERSATSRVEEANSSRASH